MAPVVPICAPTVLPGRSSWPAISVSSDAHDDGLSGVDVGVGEIVLGLALFIDGNRGEDRVIVAALKPGKDAVPSGVLVLDLEPHHLGDGVHHVDVKADDRRERGIGGDHHFRLRRPVWEPRRTRSTNSMGRERRRRFIVCDPETVTVPLKLSLEEVGRPVGDETRCSGCDRIAALYHNRQVGRNTVHAPTHNGLGIYPQRGSRARSDTPGAPVPCPRREGPPVPKPANDTRSPVRPRARYSICAPRCTLEAPSYRLRGRVSKQRGERHHRHPWSTRRAPHRRRRRCRSLPRAACPATTRSGEPPEPRPRTT
jgi:hypothetical protein